jgi:hypothetical protein
VPATVKANVPEVVTGDPVTDIKPPVKDCATLVTDPLPLLLKVVQSAALKTPRLAAEAVGTFKVMTGVVVPVATVLLRSVPDVPSVSAATLVTVPLLLKVFQSVLVK